MRKKLILIAIFALIVPLVMAQTAPGPNELSPATHSHKVVVEDYEPEFEGGAGVDVVVYKGEGLLPDEVTIEGRYDFENENGSVYVIAKYDLFERLSAKDE